MVETENLTHLGDYSYEVRAVMDIDPLILPLFTQHNFPQEQLFTFLLSVEMCKVLGITIVDSTSD